LIRPALGDLAGVWAGGSDIVPLRRVIEVGEVDFLILFHELVTECDAQRLEPGTGNVVRPDAVGTDDEQNVRNARSAVGRQSRLGLQHLVRDGGDERVGSKSVGSSRHLEQRERGPVRLKCRGAVAALDHDRPLPGTGRALVGQDGERACSSASFHERFARIVAHSCQNVVFQREGLGLRLDRLRLGVQGIDLLVH
jgi:hypothetical protein